MLNESFLVKASVKENEICLILWKEVVVASIGSKLDNVTTIY
jgi:hypothetical protein